jgi:hypothetical protein
MRTANNYRNLTVMITINQGSYMLLQSNTKSSQSNIYLQLFMRKNNNIFL